jgi:hypothetical protein
MLLPFFREQRERWAFSRLIGNREGDEVWEDLGIVEGFDQRKVPIVLEEVFRDVSIFCVRAL